MKVAVAQMSSQSDLASNLAHVRELARDAQQLESRLLALPEGFAFLGAEQERCRHAEALDGSGPIISALVSCAQDRALWILGGGMPERSSDPARPYNTSVLIDPAGRLVASYRKIHLFDVALDDGTTLRESSGSTAGETLCVSPVGEHRLGQAVCYDVRFPYLFEGLRRAGATVISVPAAFTRTTGAGHWHVLLRARAIESQCWLLAPAQCGDHPHGRKTYGHSLIVDPWGRVLAELETGTGLVTAELDLEMVHAVRRQLPVFEHRRLLP